jgi:hypothetical protein
MLCCVVVVDIDRRFGGITAYFFSGLASKSQQKESKGKGKGRKE